jgi:hypothetical protein
MSLPTINDVQAVEPILTNLLVGYEQADTRFIATRLCPGVSVPRDSGTFYIFTKKYWFLSQMTNRAPGQQYPRADFGVETGTYATLQYALSKFIADEERANSLVPMDLETAATRWLAQQSLLKKEIAMAAKMFAGANYDSTQAGQSSGTYTKWSDYQASDPVADVEYAKETVSNNTGQTPNTMAMGSIVRRRLINHPDLLDRVKYTTAAMTGKMDQVLADIFDVSQVLVSRATYSNTNEAATFSATAIVDDDCLIGYVAPNPGLFEASLAYRFYWLGGGGDGVVMRNRIDENDSDLIKSKEQWQFNIVAKDVAFLYTDIVD